MTVPADGTGPAARVLGPVLVPDRAGTDVAVPGALARRLVVALALAGPEGRSVGALVDEVWADDPPRSPRAALQMLVSRVRSAAVADLVVSTPVGYRLAASDLVLAERVADSLAARDAQDVVDAATGALAGWRGEPGEDLDDPDLGARLADRTRRVLTRLLGARAEALLALGDPDRAVDDAVRLAALLPLESEPVALRMRALDASGRAAEALAAYAEHRTRLADELGADPDGSLVVLHTDLLRRRPAGGTEVVGVRASAEALLGRDADLAALAAAVGEDRLVTVLGPGGMGKTRIANALALRVADRFARVTLVELAGTRTADDVLLAVAAAVGARSLLPGRRAADVAPPDLRARTVATLAASRTLLLLDNCEHVVDAAAMLVEDLLGAAGDLVVVTTSRVALQLPGERVHALRSLAPDTDGAALFERRARAARPDVRLDGGTVRRIVARLDGLPLAIELAAARLRTSTLTQLEAGLADRFALLVGGSRAAPERHRTLFAVIDWSVRLLPEAEQGALADLAVFPDGFTAESAGDLLGVPARPVLDHLVEQSLLGFQETDDGRGRFRMLETVREFGLARAEDGTGSGATELDRVVLGMCRRWAPGLTGGADPTVRLEVAAEEETLRAVLRPPVAGRGAVVLAVFALLAEYWISCGEFETALDRIPLVLEAAHRRPSTDDERADALRALVLLVPLTALGRGSLTRALALLKRARAEAPPGRTALWPALAGQLLSGPSETEAIGAMAEVDERDPVLATFTTILRSQLLENAGRGAEALAAARRAREQAERHGLPWFRLFADSTRAQLLSQRGQRAEALRVGRTVERELAAFDGRTDLQQIDWLIAINEVALGDVADAEHRLLALRSAAARQGPGGGIRSIALAGLAEVAAARGDQAGSAARWREAMDAAARTPSPWTALVRAAALADAARRGDGAAMRSIGPRLRSTTLALLRLGGVGLDRPVVSSAALGLAAALLAAPATEALGVELGGAALAGGARLDLPVLEAVARRLPDREQPVDPMRRIDELLRLPEARQAFRM